MFHNRQPSCAVACFPSKVKKLVAALVAVVCLLILTVRPGRPLDKSQTPQPPGTLTFAKTKPISRQTEGNAFQGSAAVRRLRAAIESGNEQAIEEAFSSFIQYVTEHANDTSEFLEALASEQDERMLRMFAKGFGQTALMKNDAFLTSVASLASVSSSDQRQHILLNCLSTAQQLNGETLDTITRIASADTQSAVQTSAVALLADWMHRFSDDSGVLSGKVSEILDNSTDRTVRAFCYQLLASHRDVLPRQQQENLLKYFKAESDPVLGNSIAIALSAASTGLRTDAAVYLRNAFERENNEYKRRSLLAQIACVAGSEALPFLKEQSFGDTALARDAAQHLLLLEKGNTNAESFFFAFNSDLLTGVGEH